MSIQAVQLVFVFVTIAALFPTMPRSGDVLMNRAVCMVLNSAATPIEAVRACGLKDNAVVNVRKRVLLRRKRDAEAARIESEAIALR